ncbi:MAG: toll/interleukin-1 receptor domain-containing protein [Litoreibacter sp.]|uniref:toll/interleukin-1 receptor domain-containing protein n=1 Tax=Litoreibacter sp. TaxID=1969459 RepID=UPI0032985629
MTQVFISYSHKDEEFRQELESHLSLLRRQELIDVWHDRRITAGQSLDDVISEELGRSKIVLLLISSDFIASDYCYGNEMKQALSMNECGDARVVPIIVRSCDWHSAPFGSLLATPTDGRPISIWRDRDEAMTVVAKEIRQIAVEESKGATSKLKAKDEKVRSEVDVRPAVRSSNLAIAKIWTDREKDEFLASAFEFIFEFFDNSLRELTDRNASVEAAIERVDSYSFTATLYNHGKRVSHVSISRKSQMGFQAGRVISLSFNDSGFSEQLNLETNEHSIYLKPLGLRFSGQQDSFDKLASAEYYWSELIRPLQGN